jgi:hypothetical protein
LSPVHGHVQLFGVPDIGADPKRISPYLLNLNMSQVNLGFAAAHQG